MLSAVLRGVYTSVSLDPALIEDVVVGNVLPPGGGASAARMASLHAGIPNSSAVNTVNRQCSSGLTAINQVALEILSGQIDIGIGMLFIFPCTGLLISIAPGAGVESMTAGYGSRALAPTSEKVLSNQEAADCLIPMGITSENVAADYKISRDVQDEFAAKSFQKAAKAQVRFSIPGHALRVE
jgi:acetyl-CoA acyltransferase 1